MVTGSQRATCLRLTGIPGIASISEAGPLHACYKSKMFDAREGNFHENLDCYCDAWCRFCRRAAI